MFVKTVFKFDVGSLENLKEKIIFFIHYFLFLEEWEKSVCLTERHKIWMWFNLKAMFPLIKGNSAFS